MILKAIHEFNINPSESVLIGDKKSDILAGKNAGIAKNIFIQRLLEK
jgi:D-glycero-D-manno-heptose 1,7-bisphosphate phosphatase